MQFNIDNKVGARFKLIVHKGDGVPTRETEWFKNLVLDTGLTRMSVGEWVNRCCVGSGNITPEASQVGLSSFVSSTTMIQSSANGVVTTSPAYIWGRRTWRFGQGVAAGNLSEVGLGWSDSSLWNRALIKDINGNPTTITVLSDEYLDVVSEVRMYPVESFSGSFNLLDKNGLIISNHTYTGKPYLYSTGFIAYDQVSLTGAFANSGAYNIGIYSGNMGESITSLPTGTTYETTGATITRSSNKCVLTSNINLNSANGTHLSFAVFNSGFGQRQTGYQFQITPPITKTSAQTMTYICEYSWGRYEPT